jgi:hypothetical protein
MQKKIQTTDRRSFMKIGATAGIAALGAGLLGSTKSAVVFSFARLRLA